MKSKTELGEKIRQLLKRKDTTARDVSLKMNRIHNHVYNLIHRKLRLDWNEVDPVLKCLGCTRADLDAGTQSIPIVGTIPAGHPIELEQHAERNVEILPYENANNMFALEVTGNSMFPAYRSGDIVILKKINVSLGIKGDKPSPESHSLEAMDGCDVAFLRNNESSLKRLRFQWQKGGDFKIEFVPVNTSEYEPIHLDATDTLVIQGIVTCRRTRCPV